MLQKLQNAFHFRQNFLNVWLWDGSIIRMPLDFDSRVEVNWIIMLMMQKQLIRYRISRVDINMVGGGRLHISTTLNSKPFCSFLPLFFLIFCYFISTARKIKFIQKANEEVERKQKKRNVAVSMFIVK